MVNDMDTPITYGHIFILVILVLVVIGYYKMFKNF